MEDSTQNYNPTSILITLMGSLGDVARGLSLIAPLKEKFKKSTITWLVEPKCADLVKLNSQIDRVIVFERAKGFSAILKLWKDLKKDKYDLCLDLQRHFKSGVFSRLTGAARIIGFNRSDSKELNWLFSKETIAAYPKNLPKLEHYWKFLELLGISTKVSPQVNLSLDGIADVLNKFSISLSDKYIVLVLGSSWHSKDWPVSGYHQLIKEISTLKPEMNFILTGGKEHSKIGDQLKLSMPDSKRIFNLSGQSSLSELCSIVKNAAVVIGPDSGPGHLASMTMVPFIGLFGPTDAGRTAPYGPNVKIISANIGCSPCYRRTCPGLDKLCMRMISPIEVARAAFDII